MAQTSPHRIRCDQIPLKWHQGFPLGNGVVGAMLWGGGDPLALTLDHADLWDLRVNMGYQDHPDFNYAGLCRLLADKRFAEVDEIFEQRYRRDNPVGPTKISIGRMELRLGTAARFEGGLDLDKGIFEGHFITGTDEYRVWAFVHRDSNLVCLRVEPEPRHSALDLIPLSRMNETLAQLRHPEPTILEEGSLRILIQHIPEDLYYAVAWNPAGPDYFISVETGATAKLAADKARTGWREGMGRGFESLCRQHESKWQTFWSASAVHLPEPGKELLWYYGLYILASSAKQGTSPPGLQGLWAMDGVMPPWRGEYAANMNIQETFWPAAASGHLDLLDCWCDYMKTSIEPAQAFTRKFFATEGTFWITSTLPRYTFTYGWHTVQFAWNSTGWLGWLVWLRWRYSLDKIWLKETGYPVLAEVFKFYRANLQKESDGCLHVPVSSSPEYRDNTPEAWAKDPNIDIALIRRCCDWIIEFEQALGIQELTASARDVHSELVPYALTEGKVLCLWPGKPLDESHRHPSQLMAIHPAMDLTIDGDDETRKIIEASVRHYLSLGQWLWGGHSYAQLISFAAVLGRAGWAYECLDQFHKHWIGPNYLHLNRDVSHSGMTTFVYSPDEVPPFTTESSCGVAAGISDMLIQGWNDVIRIFPAVPDHWEDIAFENLRTEGAFTVSAARRKGKTVWVRIRASRSGRCQLLDPFHGKPFTVTGGQIDVKSKLIISNMSENQDIVFQEK